MTNQAGTITELLRAWRDGDQEALKKLTPRVYRELHRAAARCMRSERDDHTLQTTALINELYLRITALQRIDWQSRAHFFAVCARQMRRILTDEARARQSHKRGGGVQPVPLDFAPLVSSKSHPEVLALDDALNALDKVDPRKCQIIELRFFGGFSVEETAQALDISVATVGREQRLAEAWLHRELSYGRTT